MLLALAALLQPDFDAVLDVPATKGSLVGACVMRQSGEVLYERNAAVRMVPASNQKLLTCAYALATLGPDYRPKTRFWKERDRIVIQAEGDPSLTLGRLREAAKAIRLDPKKPLKIVSWQAFRPYIPPSWEFDDLHARYAAPITALTVDRGAFELWASKGRIEPLPVEFGVRVVHRAGPEAATTSYDPFTSKGVVEGRLPSERTRLGTFALRDPDVVAMRPFGTPAGAAASAPSSTPTLTIEGPALKDLVQVCLTESSNLYAENILLMAAAKMRPDQIRKAAYPEATRLLAEWLTQQVGIEPGDTRPDDGSGLSRHNFVTPRALCRLLLWSKDQTWGEAFEAGMVRPGRGTLRTRLEASSIVGKTGTLDAVVALSGWAVTKSGERVVFSALLNHGIVPSREQSDVLDTFAREVEKLDLPQAKSGGTYEAFRRSWYTAQLTTRSSRISPMSVIKQGP